MLPKRKLSVKQEQIVENIKKIKYVKIQNHGDLVLFGVVELVKVILFLV